MSTLGSENSYPLVGDQADKVRATLDGSAASFSYSLRLLGAFALTNSDVELSIPPGGERLVAFVALEGRPVRRGRVAGGLWPEACERTAQANLRSTLHRVSCCAPQLLVSSHDTLTLRAHVDIFLGDIECADRKVVRDRVAGLLPGWNDDWVVFERERLRQRYLHELEAIAASELERGCFGAAISAALASIAIEPLRESPHRLLARAHVAEGNLSEAVRTVRQFEALLDHELGIAPTDELYRVLGFPDCRDSPETL